MKAYAKTLVVLVGLVVTRAIGDGLLDGDAALWATNVLNALTVIGVYVVKNEPAG